MIRVFSEPPLGDAQTAVDKWVSNHNEWNSDPASHSLTIKEIDGGQFLMGDYRFIQEGETPTGILTDLSDRLKSVQGGLWHRLGYHVCSHDETSPAACAWDTTVEYGTVPAFVPEVNP